MTKIFQCNHCNEYSRFNPQFNCDHCHKLSTKNVIKDVATFFDLAFIPQEDGAAYVTGLVPSKPLEPKLKPLSQLLANPQKDCMPTLNLDAGIKALQEAGRAMGGALAKPVCEKEPEIKFLPAKPINVDVLNKRQYDMLRANGMLQMLNDENRTYEEYHRIPLKPTAEKTLTDILHAIDNGIPNPNYTADKIIQEDIAKILTKYGMTCTMTQNSK